MDPTYTPSEQKLIEHAQKAVIEYNQIRHAHGGIDTLYAFVLSTSSQIHDGACFESSLGHAGICGERHAIANLILAEGYAARIQSILVADPVPSVQENSTTPCGTCRHLIREHGSPQTTILCMQYIQGKDGWTFPKVDKFTIAELYPHAYEPVQWEKNNIL